MAQYFYDNQIRRFLLQFAKIFSNWYVTQGNDPNGNPILVRVPIQYGDSSRQAATIIANNSASNLPSAPLMTYFIKENMILAHRITVTNRDKHLLLRS